MTARNISVFVVLGLLLFAAGCGGPSYGLPVVLGSTSDEVRKVLGAPTERFRPGTANDTVESIRRREGDRVVLLRRHYVHLQ
jgi:hypothetical protein